MTEKEIGGGGRCQLCYWIAQRREQDVADEKGAVKGSCHCGAVTLRVPHAPEWVGSCNCSLCAKTDWLVAYFPTMR